MKNTILTTLLLFSMTLNAEEGLIESLLLHINENGIEVTQNEDLKVDSASKELLLKLSFVFAYKDMSALSLPLSMSEKDLLNYSKLIVSMGPEDSNLELEQFDTAYVNTQEYCLFLEEDEIEEQQKCDAILDLFDQFNEEINRLIDNGLKTLDPGQAVKDLFGITLSGEDLVEAIKREDPNSGLMENAENINSHKRSSPLDKLHGIDLNLLPKEKKRHTGEILADDRSLESAICEIGNTDLLQDYSEEMLGGLIDFLKAGLVADQTSLEDKKSIYCALDVYFTQNDLHDELFDFLYLNMPDGENFCPAD